MGKVALRAVDVIRSKRDGEELPEDALAWFVRAASDGTVTDDQAAAFLMAVFFAV
ncbi:MAG: hypothetical protein M5R36_14325 [Deltaproteobacteria bacterium]|nr:hypothetical protein [Deltaproteobacteria bacterium]